MLGLKSPLIVAFELSDGSILIKCMSIVGIVTFNVLHLNCMSIWKEAQLGLLVAFIIDGNTWLYLNTLFKLVTLWNWLHSIGHI